MHEQIAYRQVPRRTSAPVPVDTEEDDAIYRTRPRSSAIRWTDRQGNQVVQQGNRKVVIHKEPPPKQRSHWLVFFGIVLLVMMIGWLLMSALGAWWQAKQDDWKYGTPRTAQVDQFVGHGDTPDHPDHFIAVNTGGMIEVVELNVINPKYDHVYPITTAIDAATPVSLRFEDTNHDGKIDLLVSIGDSNPYTVVMLNNGTQFTR